MKTSSHTKTAARLVVIAVAAFLALAPAAAARIPLGDTAEFFAPPVQKTGIYGKTHKPAQRHLIPASKLPAIIDL
jgi:hypothetical protein